MRLATKLYLSLVILIAGIPLASAQVVGGTISGTVHEATGASLAGAAVTVRQIETGATRILTTDADGRFYAPSVPVGRVFRLGQPRRLRDPGAHRHLAHRRPEPAVGLRPRRCSRRAAG